LNKKWCTWLLSGFRGDLPFKDLLVNMRTVSYIGTIIKAMPAVMGALIFQPSEASIVPLVSIKRITNAVSAKPRLKEPVSPINILAGCQLKAKKESTPPTKVTEIRL